MAAPAKYTESKRQQALAIYQQEGAAAASKATGVPRGTISSWARRAGIQTDAPTKTAAATLAAAAKIALRREQLRGLIADQLVETIRRMNAPHIEVKVLELEPRIYLVRLESAVAMDFWLQLTIELKGEQ